MMLSDQWTIMNNSSSELDHKQPGRRRSCCRLLLWSSVVLLVTAAVVTATAALLHLHHVPLPFLNSPPSISPHPAPGALVTISRAAPGAPVSVFLEPRCPDLSPQLLRWEGLQGALLGALGRELDRDRGLDQDQGRDGDRGLVQELARDLAALTGHAHSLRLEAEALRRGQAALDQQLDQVLVRLQAEQSREAQMLSSSRAEALRLSEVFGAALLDLQRETQELKGLRVLGGPASRPRDCSEVRDSGASEDGVYSVFPPHHPDGFRVFCDMSTDGGGWTVFQRREDGSVNFFRGWEAYRDGFGKTTGEHWLGLQRLSALTGSGGYELRIDMADFSNASAFALYADFSVGRDSVNPEEDGYPLTVEGYSGTAGDSLLKHSGMQFTTRDRDQDQSENNCAAYYQGAWWYRNCHTSNLNGQYLGGGHASYADGVEWSSWTGWQYSLRFTEMKIRPRRPGTGVPTAPGTES